ncbi:NAD(P)H-dependent oxidoreductase [Pontibacter qinzhouensis]|uniref:NAD(P)H-dependent oxidoreductase n=1 Tax=Pontibacter qinzhouensis TaxID=2603253 RepID=A0A5C8JJK3_9BACT|nr:NAD(P)H-dependent oxidoreductase [Pontibacter qinzhouensis]TXK37798.1 NAD(P)H-dependent oxidoreductase [Pontibacter qinzhouensis]
MKPDDKNAALPLEKQPFRVLLISASQRRQYNCPGVDSKSRTLLLRMAEQLPQDWEIDLEDIGNVYARERIQSCNACVSTSMAPCVWPCNCYEKDSKAEPDLLWNLDLYARLDMADAWAFVAPHNWYGPTSNLKLLFDRLVCMNGGNPNEELIEHKNPELAMKLDKTPEWEELSQNHLEGRTAAFFCHGDLGGDEIDATGRPRLLHHKLYFDPEQEPFQDERDAYAPLVWQCRYSGIEVPDQLWTYAAIGEGKKYSENQAEDMVQDNSSMAAFDKWVKEFAQFVEAKGKVQPGKFRAYGYKAPSHTWQEIKLGWRDARMRIGFSPAGSSPKKQQDQGLNKDVTLFPGKSENERNG